MTQSSPKILLGELSKLLAEQATADCSDRDLLDRFSSERQELPFAVLMRRHGPLVLGVCRRVLRHEQDAEDAFQATFLTLARQAGKIRQRESLSSWLYQVAYRIALKVRQATSRPYVHERSQKEQPEHPLDVMSGRELLAALDEELQQVPEKYRAPLVLCFLQGATQDEASRQLGWPRGTVKDRLEQGKELLRKRLAYRGLTLPAALLPLVLTQNLSEAAVPSALLQQTAPAALAFAAGKMALTVTVSAQAIALAKSMPYGLICEYWKIVTLFAALAILATGIGWAIHSSAVPPAAPAQAPAIEGVATLPTGDGLEERPRSRTDIYGDPLPEGALARLGTVRWRHGFTVSSFAYSPDGKTAALAGEYHQAPWLVDAATGKEIRQLQGKVTNNLWDITFSPDGKLLAAQENGGSIQLYDVASGKFQRRLTSPRLAKDELPGAGIALAFSPDGKHLAQVFFRRAVDVWEVASGKELPVLKLEDGQDLDITALAFPRDGKTLVAAGHSSEGGCCYQWELATGKQLQVLKLEKNKTERIVPVLLTPDGQSAVMAGIDGQIRLLEVSTGKELRRFGGMEKAVIAQAMSPDAKILAAWTKDQNVYLWDVGEGKEPRRFTGPSVPNQQLLRGFAMYFSPNNKTLAFRSGGNAVRIWDTATLKEVQPLGGHCSGVGTTIFAPDGKTLVSSGGDSTIRVWDRTTTQESRQLALQPEENLHIAAMSPDGRTIALKELADNRSVIRLRDVSTGKDMQQFEHPQFSGLLFSPDGKSLTSWGWDATVRVWDLSSQKQICKAEVERRWMAPLPISPDGRFVAVGISSWNGGHEPANSIRLFEVATGREVHQFGGHVEPAYSTVFSPNGKMLAVGTPNGSIQLWEVATGKQRHQWKAHRKRSLQSHVNMLAFSPDGKTLASAGADATVALWEVTTGKELARFQGHRSSISSVAFSADGRELASASYDTTVLIWDALGQIKEKQTRIAQYPPARLPVLWTDLASTDAAKASEALAALAAAPDQTVALVRENLPPVAVTVDPKRVAQWLADLDSGQFATRQQAEEELERLGELAEPALRQALDKKPPLDTRARLERLLGRFSGPITAPDRLRVLRAIEVLEHIGTKEARSVVEKLAAGTPGVLTTREAKAALERLGKRQ